MGRIISGGAFLLPYLVIMVLLIVPIIVVETGTGQFFRKPIYTIYEKYCLKWTGTIFLVLGVTILVSSYYIYLMAYCLIYLYVCVFEELDWLYLPENQLIFALKKYFEEYILQSSYDRSSNVFLKGISWRGKWESIDCSDLCMDYRLSCFGQRNKCEWKNIDFHSACAICHARYYVCSNFGTGRKYNWA